MKRLLLTIGFLGILDSLVSSVNGNAPCCDTPKVIGPCKARLRRYSFVPKTESCDVFYYGGCLGNQNNFLSYKQCSYACKVSVNGNAACCLTPKVIGPCYARLWRYSFVPETESCNGFYYGGCLGNQNNFLSYQQCIDTCNNPCAQTPAVTGRGRAYFQRYTYNQESGQCERFIYGGIGGNDNRFRTEDECKRTCINK